MSSWELGYGDFEMMPDLEHAAPGAMASRGRPSSSPTSQWHDHAPVVASPRQILRRRSTASPSAACRLRRHRARVHHLPQHLRGGLEQGLPRPRRRPTTTTSTTRCSGPPASSRCAPDPQRDGRRRHEGRELQGRVQLRPARDQLPLRRGARDGRRPRRSTRPARRRSPPRRAWRSPTWRSSTSARATRATSTCSLRQRRTATNVVRRRPADIRALRRRPARLHARADALLRAERQLLQALRRGLVRADRGRVGQRQPHVLAARRRPRRAPAARAPPAGRRREPVPRARAR